MVISHDLCIGPSMLGDGKMQSLLKIKVYVLSSDYYEESEPANFFFETVLST